ncbi:hypothetical protein HJC23_012033, partial [Cyclotella cryptica]
VHLGEYHNYFQKGRDCGDGSDDDGKETVNQRQTNKIKDGDNNRIATIKAETNPSRLLDSNDNLVLNLLYEASMEVYLHGALMPSDLYPPFLHPPTTTINTSKNDCKSIKTPILTCIDRDLRWEIGWKLIPLDLHLVCSWGIHPTVGKLHLFNGKESVDTINLIWWEHSTEEKLNDFLVEVSPDPFPGNHPGYSQWETHGHSDDNPTDTKAVCTELKTMLNDTRDVDRIGVGHMPDFHV